MLLLSLRLLLPDAAALDIDTFSLASSALDAEGGLQVESPTLAYPGSFYGGLGLVYAHAPLVRIYADGTEEWIVSDSFATRLAVGYTIGSAMRLGLDFPLYPYVGGATDAFQSGPALGDARLRGVVPIPLGEGAPVSLAVIPSLSLPTGTVAAFTGAGGVGGGLAAAVRFTPVEKLDIDANLGFRAGRQDALGDQAFGTGLDVAFGAAYALREDISVGLELDGTADLAGGLGMWMDNPVELTAYGRYGKDAGIQALFGLGTGIVGGVGAPDARVIAGLGWRIPGEAPVRDTDGDTIFDDTDACIDTPEDSDGFEDTDGCPEADNDRDGIEDRTDACPLEPEDRDGFKDLDGCPDPDNDADGVLDPVDACPDVAGAAATNGCPDRDGDTVLDDADACPDVAGLPALAGCPDRDADRVEDPRDRCPDEPIDPREDPSRSDGCPRRVFVTLEKIEILEKVYFATGKTTIKKASFGLLDDVAKVLNANPDIRKIEVAGHTDSVGNDGANLRLSQGRAEAVVKHLATVGGVSAERLTGVGYGEVSPIDTNATDPGRGNNRRVEFVIKAIDAPKQPVAPAAKPPTEAAPADAP